MVVASRLHTMPEGMEVSGIQPVAVGRQTQAVEVETQAVAQKEESRGEGGTQGELQMAGVPLVVHPSLESKPMNKYLFY